MATTTIINSLTLTSVPTLPSVNANITGSVRLPQFKGLKIKPTLKTRSFGSLSQNPSSKLARGASVVCMTDATAVGGPGPVANATTVETNGIIHNNTQDPLKKVDSHDWAGKIGFPPYGQYIESGEACKFKHDGVGGRSSAAVVYRGRNADGFLCDFLSAWSKDSHSSKAYTEIQVAPHEWDWADINAKLHAPPYTYKGCVSDVTFSNEFEAKLSLQT